MRSRPGTGLVRCDELRGGGRSYAHDLNYRAAHATLDGVIDAPPADALLPYMSDAGRQGALDLALAADALLLARETWQGLARAWRDQTGPMAERLNAMPKYVVSATLKSADEWDHTTIVGYDDIAGLREREQLLTYGCGRLARDLLADGLLDVLVLSLTPVVAGAGRRLFDDPDHLVRLRLTDSTTFETGAVRLSLSRITPDRSYNRVLLSMEAVAQTTHRSGVSICDGATTLRAAEDGLQVGQEPRQSDESRYVSHQSGSKAFGPLCATASMQGNTGAIPSQPPAERASETEEAWRGFRTTHPNLLATGRHDAAFGICRRDPDLRRRPDRQDPRAAPLAALRSRSRLASLLTLAAR